MKAEDREALISLVEDINDAVCADVEDAKCFTSLNFGSTSYLDYLEFSTEVVWTDCCADVVFDQLEAAYTARKLEAQAALKCLKDMKQKGHYKQFQKLDDDGVWL